MNVTPDYPDYTYIEYCQLKKDMRDKFLTEAMGECWHEYYPNRVILSPVKCLKCGRDTYTPSLANKKYFDTWEGFGKLWEWCNSGEFKNGSFIKSKTIIDPDNMHLPTYLIHPNRFANAVYEYLKDKQCMPQEKI